MAAPTKTPATIPNPKSPGQTNKTKTTTAPFPATSDSTSHSEIAEHPPNINKPINTGAFVVNLPELKWPRPDELRTTTTPRTRLSSRQPSTPFPSVFPDTSPAPTKDFVLHPKGGRGMLSSRLATVPTAPPRTAPIIAPTIATVTNEGVTFLGYDSITDPLNLGNRQSDSQVRAGNFRPARVRNRRQRELGRAIARRRAAARRRSVCFEVGVGVGVLGVAVFIVWGVGRVVRWWL